MESECNFIKDGVIKARLEELETLLQSTEYAKQRPKLQTSQLKKELDELRKNLSSDSVSHALRDVKEYAARSSEVNVDTLQLKLMHLDEVARKTTHDDRELYALTLQRFLCHKQHPKIGFLVTSLLSSPAKTKLFEKEQKFLKLHGKDEPQGSVKTAGEDKEKKSAYDLDQSLQLFYAPISYTNDAVS